ncbi:MAG TPA: DUF2071 domain-containing protein [Thermoanaerobaculia bacterium]|nr:DUF2071 domain-containing protein [Thermoanaerobaculia bacterium]
MAGTTARLAGSALARSLRTARGTGPARALTRRYRLYAQSGRTLYRAEITHEPWALQRARAEIVRNTMPSASGIELPADSPLLHFSRALDVRVGWPEKV